jgi:hypothetical protein
MRRVKVMSKYPLKIERVVEFEGVSTTGYYSKGHHDKNEFIEAVKGDYEYEGNIDDVRHIYIKVLPSPTGGMLINYRNEPCRGSFPATVIDV